MAGLAASLAVVGVAVAAWLVLRPDTYVAAPLREAPRSSARPDLAAQALDRLVLAVARRDPALAEPPAGSASAGADGADGVVGAVVANARALDVTDFSARYVQQTGAVDASGRWRATVEMAWRFAGYDSGPVRTEVTVGFTTDGRRATVSGFGGGPGRTPLWLASRVRVARTPTTLVLGPDAGAVARYASLATRAVPVVARVVTGWRGPLVVEVPGSESGLDASLGVSADTYAGVAAVTASVDGSTARTAPVHVFVNPQVMGQLDRAGAQVVLSHEATHLATGAATNGRRPIWLTEGFADYVALRDVDLPLGTTAGQILAQVRREGPPRSLPDRSDFDSHSERFGAEYEAAWLACKVLAERGGEQALVALYDRVGAGDGLDASLRDLFGFGVQGFTRLWRERLSDWAR